MFNNNFKSQPRASFLFPAIWFSALCLGLLLAGGTQAQDILHLNEDDKSVIAFDIQVDTLSAQAEKLGLDLTMFDNDNSPVPWGKVKLADVEQVFGAASIPADTMEVAKQWTMGAKYPLDYFIQLKFKDAEQLESVESDIVQQGKLQTITGKEFYTFPQSGTSMVAHRYDERSFEFGSSLYCCQGNRDFRTDRLDKLFKALPNQPLRIAIDLKSSKTAILGIVEDAKNGIGQPFVSAYLDLIDNSDTVTVTLDLSAKNLLSIVAQCGDEAQAEELASGVDSLLAIIKLGYGAQMSASSPDQKKAFGFVGKMIETLAAQQDGKTVKIELAKPEGFEESVQAATAFVAVETEKMRTTLDLRLITLAVLNYESAYMEFPFGNSKGRHEKLSWRVSTLPFLEMEVYGSMDQEKGPKAAANSAFAEKMPKLFGPDGRSTIFCWIKSDVKNFGQITDGSSNTVMLIEIPEGRPWLEENPVSVEEAVAMVKGLPDGKEILISFYDGSTRKISNQVDEKTLEWLFTPDDGQVIEGF